MKKIAITLGAVLFTIMGIQAQNNTDIKKETVIRKVVTTDAYSKTVKVVEEVDEEIDVIEIPENGMNEISPNVISNKTDKTNVLKDESVTDTEKQLSDANAKAKTEATLKRELEMSMAIQANKEKLKKARLDTNQKKLNLELAERKAMLSKKIGQSAEEAKRESPAVKKAKKEYEIALENAKKAEMLMEKM